MGVIRRRRATGERGSTIVEAAVVVPTVMAILFAMLEMGLYFKDSLTVSEGVKEGARTGAAYAQNIDADYYIIQSVINAASINGQVQETIIYDAAPPSPTDQSAQNPSAACMASTTGVSVTYTDGTGTTHAAIGSCNVYLRANGDFNHVIGDFTNKTFTNSRFWPGETRLENTTDTRYTSNGTQSPGPDDIGIWVKTTHNWMTGFVSTSPTIITDQAVYRIEPRQ